VAARSPLAKLTRPKLYDALPRPRLFALLDERRSARSCGCAQRRQTTLVASYLEAPACVWRQYDASDADTATFVHYLRLAAAPGDQGRWYRD
jgi:hypothetical protein